MIFLNLLLAGGLLAASIPIAVHVMHRRKVTRIDWGAMRFLQAMMARSKRRIFLERWLLLLIRAGAIACLALALMRPALTPESDPAEAIVRHGRTGAVVLIDDSLSTGTGRAQTRIERMQELALTYLDSLDEGDELSLIRLSEVDRTLPDPLLDTDLARELVRNLEPRAVASDWPALLDAAAVQVGKHLNPDLEVVLIGDGAADGWQLQARARWADLRERLHPNGDAAVGSRGRPRLLLLQTPAVADEHNLAITGIDLDRSVVPVDRPVQIRVELAHVGSQAPAGVGLQLAVDGQAVATRDLAIDAGGQQTLSFEHRFAAGGSHLITAALTGARDHLPADDQRSHAVEVVSGLPVLLVEGRGGSGLRGGLSFVHLALDPDAALGAGEPSATTVRRMADAAPSDGLFAVDRIPAAELLHTDLAPYRVVVLGDLAGLDNDTLARIESFVVAGGGVLVGFGPQSDPAHLNRFWAREGDGFLPCPVGAVVEAETPRTPTIAERLHPALGAFRDDEGSSWQGADVRRFVELQVQSVPSDQITVPLRLEGGQPLLVERDRGLGVVACFASTLGPRWSDLVARPAFVPLMRGLVGHLGGRVLPPRNLAPGDALAHAPLDDAADLQAEGPTGEPVPLAPGRWRGRTVRTSQPVLQPGAYVVHEGERVVHYAVAVPSAESALQRLDPQRRDQALAGLDARVFEETGQLRNALDLSDEQPTELWRWFLFASLALLFIEIWYTRRQSTRERVTAGMSAGKGAA